MRVYDDGDGEEKKEKIAKKKVLGFCADILLKAAEKAKESLRRVVEFAKKRGICLFGFCSGIILKAVEKVKESIVKHKNALLFMAFVVLGAAALFNYGPVLVESIRSAGPALARAVFAARIAISHIHPAALVALFCIAAAFARIILPMVKHGVAEGLVEPYWPRAALIALLVAEYAGIVALYDKGVIIAGEPWTSTIVQFYPIVAFVAMLVLAAAVVVYLRQH